MLKDNNNLRRYHFQKYLCSLFMHEDSSNFTDIQTIRLLYSDN